MGGAALGWWRGNRVESAKDVFAHPIKSTKLILGFKPKDSEPTLAADRQPGAPTPTAPYNNASATETATNKGDANWTDRTSQNQEPVASASR